MTIFKIIKVTSNDPDILMPKPSIIPSVKLHKNQQKFNFHFPTSYKTLVRLNREKPFACFYRWRKIQKCHSSEITVFLSLFSSSANWKTHAQQKVAKILRQWMRRFKPILSSCLGRSRQSLKGHRLQSSSVSFRHKTLAASANRCNAG